MVEQIVLEEYLKKVRRYKPAIETGYGYPVGHILSIQDSLADCTITWCVLTRFSFRYLVVAPRLQSTDLNSVGSYVEYYSLLTSR